MKRFLFIVVLLAVAAVFVADRVPIVREKLPWLPHLPQLPWQKTQQSADATNGGNGEGGGRHRRGGAGGGGRRGGQSGPVPVLVAQSRYTDLPITVDILGTVQATNTVTVKTQVDGKLIEVDFKEGQDVKKGDVLARVDPRTFQASYDQAVAKKAQDESTLANAKVDLVRYEKLAQTQYGSHQQADTQQALVVQTQAIVEQDQAAIDSAKTTLDYATIRSPIDGRTGLRQVDEGNIVHAADTTGIVIVTQVKPIATVFSLPQQYLRDVNTAFAKGALKIEAFDGSDPKTVLDTGTLQVVDNTVDQTTGTVKLKGSFPNDHLLLWPGQFVNVKLYIGTLDHVVVVPTTAVQRGPDGPYVYAVGADKGTVSMRKVVVGRQTEEDSVITSGLDVPTTVVTTGFTRLTDGAKVVVSTNTASAGDQATTAGEGGDDADPAKAGQGALPEGQQGGVPARTGDIETPVRANPAGTSTATGEPDGAAGTTPPGDAKGRHGGHRRHHQDGSAPAQSGDAGGSQQNQ